MAYDVPELDRFIARDQRAIKVYVIFGACIVLLGVGVVVASFLISSDAEQGVQSFLLKLGGGFIATLSAFPLKEYLERRDRIDGVLAVKERWQVLVNSQEPPEAELNHLQQIMIKLYEKAALG